MERPALGRRTGTAAFAAAFLLAAPVMGCGVAAQEAVEAARREQAAAEATDGDAKATDAAEEPVAEGEKASHA